MFQRTFPNNGQFFLRATFLYLIHIILLLIFAAGLYAQTPNLGPQAGYLDIDIHLVTIDPNKIYKDLPADFPYPVMTVMTIKDKDNRYVHGLADTSRWLGSNDFNQNNDKINDVWRKLLEYHQEDNNYPSDRNIKHTTPSFLVRELNNVDGMGVSMALAMDYSGSMDNDIYFAEDAAKVLMNNMNNSDQMAIVKVTDNIDIFQEFTSDTSLLRIAIEKPTRDRSGTAIYKGIYETISLCIGIPGRKAVIAYTDGKENYFHYSVDEIISHANNNNVSLFTIGLGGNIDEESLRKMAYYTGGFFMKAKKAEELKKIYLDVYSQIRGYYVLAHTSTDPFTNGTWREVDITVESKGVRGRDVGNYYVPYLLPNLTIEKSVSCDSMEVINGDTVNYGAAGDTISYGLSIMNNGEGTAGDVKVVDLFGDSLSYSNFSLSPSIQKEDSVVWTIDRIDPGASIMLTYDGIIYPRLPSENTQILNQCRVYCSNDSILTDNHDEESVYAFGVPDLTIHSIEPHNLLSPGYSQKLQARLLNQGSGHIADSFRIGYYVESLQSVPVGLDTCYAILAGDSILSEGFWTPQTSGLYRIRVFVDVDDVIQESDEENNTDDCIVEVGISALTTIVGDISLSDTFLGVQSDFPEPVLSLVHVIDQNFYPIRSLANSDNWISIIDQTQLGKPAGEIWEQLSEYHQENELIPENSDVKSTMQIQEEDTSNVNVVLLLDLSATMSPFSSVTQPGLSNLVLSQSSFDDWGAVVGFNNTVQSLQEFTQEKELIENALDATYSGNQRKLYDALHTSIDMAFGRGGRNSVVCATFGEDNASDVSISEIQTEAQEKGVPLYFIDFNESIQSSLLKSLSDETGGFYLNQSQFFNLNEAFTVVDRMLRNYYVISHTTSDTVQNQTWRVVDVTVTAFDLSSRDQGYYLSPLGLLDVAVEKTAETIGMGSNPYPEGYVQPSDSIRYSLLLQNKGHHVAKNIQIQDVLYENLIPIRYNRMPQNILGDTLQWSIDSLQIGEALEIQYTCFVDTIRISNMIEIPNSVTIQCSGDTSLVNNTASDTVLYVPLISGDVSVQKHAEGDSLLVVNYDSTWYVYPDGIVKYDIDITNIGEMDCKDVLLIDILPENVTFREFSGSNNYTLEGDTLTWTRNFLAARGGTAHYTYTCQVDTFMPPWEVPLMNQITSECVEDTIYNNNSDSDTVWVAVPFPPDPKIRISPSMIEPGDSVMVEVLTPVRIQNWRMTIIYADGTTNHSFWDDFISSTYLAPQEWKVLKPDLNDTRMRTDAKEERVKVIFETTDLWHVTRADTGYFDIRSENAFYLDQNVFRINEQPTLGIRFKLSSNRRAKIVVYDIAGTYIKTVTDNAHIAGWNQVSWDGRNFDKKIVGDGVYVAVLTSGQFKQVRKFILVR